MASYGDIKRNKIDLRKHDVTLQDKIWIVSKSKVGSHATKELAKRYNLHGSTIRKWRSLVDSGKCLHEHGGRPKICTAEDEKSISEDVVECENADQALTFHEFHERVV